jgi:beta-N-acetylhexosaminidase
MSAEIAALVDRCLMVSMTGARPSPRLVEWLGEGLGGILLYQLNIRDVNQTRQLCTELRAAGTDLLIAADAEGGDNTPIYPGEVCPHPAHLALGALDDPAVTRSVGIDIANDMAAAGLNLNLAPVADVATNPASPAILTRAFGADPARVAAHAVAYADGLAAAGIAAAGKHFPGIGAATKSSDLAFPISPGPLDLHLEPFRSLIDTGVPALLTSHAIYPDVGPEPGTFSRIILGDLLRDRLGFLGVVISDSVTTAMVIAHLGSAEAAVRAFAGGVDAVCMMGGLAEQRRARDAVIAAIGQGRLSAQRMADSAERVGALARAHAKPAGLAQHRVQWGPQLAERMMYVDASLPLPGSPHVIEFAHQQHGGDVTGAGMLNRLQRLDPEVTGVRMAENAAGLSYAVRAAPPDRPLLLVVQDAHLDQRLCRNIGAIRELRPDAIVVGLGAAVDAQLAPGHFLGSRGVAEPCLAAVARCLIPR